MADNETRTDLDLASFDISENTGFLPEFPLEKLPAEFQAWHDVISEIDNVDIDCTQLRRIVDTMPLLDHGSLTKPEARLAHLLLTYVAQSYVWRFEPDPAIKLKCLPSCLAVPWNGVSEMLGLPPVLTYLDFTLANVILKDQSVGYVAGNMRCIRPMPTEDTIGLAIVGVLIESEFATGLKHIVKGDKCIYDDDDVGLTRELLGLATVLQKFSTIFHTLKDLLGDTVFFEKIIPFIQAWGDKNPIYPEGMVYDGVSKELKKFEAASAGQSSIFQSTDAFLGVEHETDARKHAVDLRKYMPEGHRRFIDTLESRRSAATLVRKAENKELRDAYNSCVEHVKAFRTHHMTIVHKYQISPAKKAGLPPDDPLIKGVIPALRVVRDAAAAHKIDK